MKPRPERIDPSYWQDREPSDANKPKRRRGNKQAVARELRLFYERQRKEK